MKNTIPEPETHVAASSSVGTKPDDPPMRDRPRTLAQALAPHAVDADVLETRYQPMLRLVRELIGVVPSADAQLELWPPAFRSYNLIVPSLLHLPPALFGLGAPKALVGLAMYTSSRAAECTYCSAHTCSYALRRGASAESVIGERTGPEKAVVRVAEGLSRQPPDVSTEDITALREVLPDKHVARVVAGIALMGFLNKFMDAMGTELEPEPMAEVARLIGSTGWTPGQHQWGDTSQTLPDDPPPVDTLSTLLHVVRQAPGAIRLEREWTRGVPFDPVRANAYLRDRSGIECSLLADLPDRATVRALATVLRDNLDSRQSGIGIVTKGLAGLVYAAANGNAELGTMARAIVRAHTVEAGACSNDAATTMAESRAIEHAEKDAEGAPVPDKMLEGIEQLATTPVEQADWSALAHLAADPTRLAVLHLAHAVSSSPARVSGELVTTSCDLLTPAQIIETLCWVSVNQLMHRLLVFRKQANSLPYPGGRGNSSATAA